MTLLDVDDLSVTYEPVDTPPTHAVRNVSFCLQQGEFVGIVGESGSGKSTLGFAITSLLRRPATISSGTVLFDGIDTVRLTPEELRRRRQGGFAMVLQSGMNALNPVRRISKHFFDIFQAHGHIRRNQYRNRGIELLGKVNLQPSVMDNYPGELSGGMRQRVSIALALSLDPRLMIFDEPTTALDVLVQRAVMNTIRDLQAQEGFTAILISHDLGMVLESVQRVLVMHNGQIIEDGSAHDIYSHPQSSYTKMLLSNYADPRAEVITLPGLPPIGPTRDVETEKEAQTHIQGTPSPIILEHITKVFPPSKHGEKAITAVDDVSFRLEPAAAVALVGQSGSGKSTIANMITGVERPTSGTLTFGDMDIAHLKHRDTKKLHQQVQMVFQDPYSALNPLHTVEYTLTRPVVNYTHLKGQDAEQRVYELLELVDLTPQEEFIDKLPHQLSGGQRQRVVIARALASNPSVIIADEPVSMLDVSLRAGVLALLRDLRQKTGVSLLYITHDLLSARVVTDDILVLHDGKIVERGGTATTIRNPQDTYTSSLLDAIPEPAKRFEEDAS